jgi:hypothetical protein
VNTSSKSRLKAVARSRVDSVDEFVAIQRGDVARKTWAVEAMTTNESPSRPASVHDAGGSPCCPELANNRNAGRLTIWNAHGQSPYTLAMTVTDHLPTSALPGCTRTCRPTVRHGRTYRRPASTAAEVNQILQISLSSTSTRPDVTGSRNLYRLDGRGSR